MSEAPETMLSMDTVTRDLWTEYSRSRSLADRNRLIVHYGSLVRYVASRVAMGLPQTVDREDLVSYGQFGLIDAIERFDLDRGVKFETFAIARIRGAIIDEIRALDWVPRSIRAKARDVERVVSGLETELGRAPEDEEIAAAMGITLAELWIAQSQANVTAVTALEAHEGDDDRPSESQRLTDLTATPEDMAMVSDLRDMIAKAVESMPERSRVIVVLYYIEELTLAEIGEILGVTESRVCQLQSKVLHQLRASLGLGRVAA